MTIPSEKLLLRFQLIVANRAVMTDGVDIMPRNSRLLPGFTVIQ
jgi:hypothetical protein